LGGDFNLVRFQSDKSNGNVDLRWCEKFNDWVDRHSLMEINLLGRSFTWSNNQENQILSHRYRFMFENWWLQHSGFEEVVQNVWSKKTKGKSAIDRWQEKVRIIVFKASLKRRFSVA
jgi:hypothetical protein